MIKTLSDLERTENGYLCNPNDWDIAIAIALAKLDGIELSDDHFQCLNVLRDFYVQYQRSPATRIYIKQLKQVMGETRGNSLYFLSLFPKGLGQAAKIAGIPKPSQCLD